MTWIDGDALPTSEQRCESFSDYLVFVDESGDHSLESINPDYPIFVLAFCIVPRREYVHQITPAVRQLKCDLFGHDLVILHEHDIRKRSGPFSRLNKESRDRLMLQLTEIIAAAPMTIIAVVIHKERHRAKYSSPIHPYELALQFGLERVYGFLQINGQSEGVTQVICEARGAKEDRDLELAFRRVCDGDNRSRRAYPFSIVVAHKQTNSEGLQLADLVARPLGLRVLRPEQPNRTWDILEPKLYRGAYGTVSGNGLKVFP